MGCLETETNGALMTTGFILNGEDVTVETETENRLVDLLRNSFRLIGTKAGCLNGSCGVCSVIFNGTVVKSCLIPAFRIKGSEIITIEGFSLTDDYQDITHGFAEAGFDNCGYCNTGKILAAEALLSKNLRPAENDILKAFYGIKCRCTEPEGLVKAVLAAAEHRRRRLYGLSP
jgi:carbon-monoxide dehydrogenase small subunit